MNQEYSVAKFGGTSVADHGAMNRCAQIIAANNNVRVVVVSASAGVTNHLVALCQSALTPQQRQAHIDGAAAAIMLQRWLDEHRARADNGP